MSVMAIGPVSFVNATSLVETPEPEAQGSQPDGGQKLSWQIASDTSSSHTVALALQAFMAFQPDVQPVASLKPGEDTTQALPIEVSADFSGSTQEWSGGVVNVYA